MSSKLPQSGYDTRFENQGKKSVGGVSTAKMMPARPKPVYDWSGINPNLAAER